MFRDGIFESFGDFLDKVNESIFSSKKVFEEVWELESEEEKNASEHLSSLVAQALEGQGDIQNIQNYLSRLWGESWEIVKNKLETEGSTWYVWWMDGVREHMKNNSVEESKLQEQNRKEAEQTELPDKQPPKEDAERLSMEDWSDTDKEGKPKRKDKVEYPSKLYEPTDKELSDEIKYERKLDPLYLCNECFKTFRCNQPVCKCGSKVVERITKIKEAGKSKVEMDGKKYIVIDGLCPDGQEEVLKDLRDIGVEVIGPKEHKDLVLVLDTVENMKKANEYFQVGNSKIKENGSDISLYKNVFSVQYKLSGREEETRVEAYDEEDAKKYVKRIKPGAEVLNVKKIGESKKEEKITPEGIKNIAAPRLTFDYGTVQPHEKVIEDLAETNFFKTRMVGTRITLIDAKGRGETFAMDEDKNWKIWSDSFGFSESKINEQDVESLRNKKLELEQKMLDAEKKYQDEQKRINSEVEVLNKRIQDMQSKEKQ